MKQSQEKVEEKTLNPILVKIGKILDIDEGELQVEEKTKGFSATFERILKENSDNKKFALIAVTQESGNYYQLSHELRKDKNILELTLTSFVREGKNFLDVNDFLERVCTDDERLKKKLFKFYENCLNTSESIVLDDFSKSIIELQKNNKLLFEKLKEQKIISGKGKKLGVNKKLVQGILILLDTEPRNQPEEEKGIIISFLLEKIGLKKENIDGELEFLFETFVTLLFQERDKKELKGATEEEKKDKLFEREEIQEDDILEAEEYSGDEKLDYCYPECNYSYGGGDYHIETAKCSLKISEKDLEDFTSKALKNFIKFYEMLSSLGLSFLWDKYSTQFTTLCNNTFGFDYKRGEGLTESKNLSVLNLIGKNIGIPTKKVITQEDESSKEKRKRINFERLEEAKSQFKAIKETGKIGGEIYSDLGINSPGAVEVYLDLQGKIDRQKGTIDINKW